MACKQKTYERACPEGGVVTFKTCLKPVLNAKKFTALIEAECAKKAAAEADEYNAAAAAVAAEVESDTASAKAQQSTIIAIVSVIMLIIVLMVIYRKLF